MTNKFQNLAADIKKIFNSEEFIPLHEPRFNGNEKLYLNQCIDSTFVSYLGEFVKKVEKKISDYTNAKYVITTDNGTSALHLALIAIGADSESEVITQALSFVATANSISYTGAKPVFLDVDLETLGLSPKSLLNFLKMNVSIDSQGTPRNKLTNKKIAACVPMHTFGNPCYIDQIVKICREYNIPIVEDSAESIGSFYNKQHTGTFGDIGIFSFNGNKVVTSGGGGAVITNNENLAKKIMHISTTAKRPHPYEYFHDEIGFNYRMPNLNAAVLYAQLEQLDSFLLSKNKLIQEYEAVCEKYNLKLFKTNVGISNNWLIAIILDNLEERELALKTLNELKVMSRPIWTPLCDLPHFKNCYRDELINTYWLHQRLINVPSSARI